ncbi:MAG: ComF family protein [Candidatus Omnitrophota bacterium]|nr:ComF family protein [Candidatus Omnitrophota bacterium]
MCMLFRFIRRLTDIAYPKVCLACKRKLDAFNTDGYICNGCRLKIKRNLPPFCASCGRHLEKKSLNKNICPACLKKRLHFDRAFSPCLYEGVTKELIHEFKYKSKDHLGKPLSKIMIEFIKEYELPVDYLDFIIPIPLHKARLREREFNQAEILSRQIALEFKKDLITDALYRHRLTKTQTGLATDKRFANVKESFFVSQDSDLKNKNILIVDDVLTTGATSSEAALSLKDAGANIVFVLTLAN